MKVTPRQVGSVLLVGTVAVLGVDYALYSDDVDGNTISSVVQAQPWSHGLLGFVAVHLARRPEERAPLSGWTWTIVGAIISALASLFLGGGLVGLALGAGVGWLAWGSSGKH